MDVVVLLARLFLGGLLLLAGALKIGHAADLAAAIAGFRLLPAAIVGPLALALPYFELLLGGYLIAGLFVRIAAAIACVQFLAYAAAIASAVLRHLPAACGCFGPGDTAVADWPHVVVDVALAAVSAAIAAGAPGAWALDRRMRSA